MATTLIRGMEILGFFGALIIGFSLGLIGSGGSILTVPIMVYLLGIDPVLATAYSLFIIGTSSLVGAVARLRVDLVDLKTAVVFAIPSLFAVYLTRLYLIPSIPDEIGLIGNFSLTKNMVIMVFFAFIMLLSSFSMLTSTNYDVENRSPGQFNSLKIVVDGLVIGVITGIVGAGGGFLIIPALVLFARLPMKLAIGTSLMIIATKSLFGFAGDIQSGQIIDWSFLLLFTGLAIMGIFIGGYLNRFVSDMKLKKVFGWFLLVMSSYILIKELILT